MDTTETNIKMCEKAEEIQALRREEHNKDTGKWQAGDFWTHIGQRIVFIVPDYRDAWADIPEYIHHPSECIWLPDQSQLQEMVEGGLWNKCGRFYEWLFDSVSDGWHVNHQHLSFTSMEQLWLALVMKEKYNKTWNGEDWV